MSSQPAAFMSYVRFNDQHDDGQLTQFRERLAAEVRVQTARNSRSSRTATTSPGGRTGRPGSTRPWTR
jgi:hypothetical protein